MNYNNIDDDIMMDQPEVALDEYVALHVLCLFAKNIIKD